MSTELMTPALLLLLILQLSSFRPSLCQLRVETEDAIYHGRLLSLSIQQPALQTVAHLGIPYAQPPLGQLRFAPPVPWKPPGNASQEGDDTDWNIDSDKPEVNATRAGPACLQRPDPDGTPARMSEDCLYLSILSPTWVSPPQGRPVLVWLHGGYFETGAVSDPDAGGVAFTWDLVANQQSLVAVEVAYRLGAFGFLSLADTAAAGNAGLLDQQLALAWIARNVGHFGGDNGSVTLAGLDAGAAAVGFHMVSEGSRDLFQRCAFFGGSPVAGWALVRDRAALGLAHQEFYRLVGCHGNQPTQTLACLRNLSTDSLNARQSDFNRAFNRVEFPPVVDGRFLTADPLVAFERGSFETKAAMIGATNLEGVQLAYRALRAFNVTDRSLLVGKVHLKLLDDAFRYLPRFPDQLASLARDFLAVQLTAYPSASTGQGNFDLLIRAISQQVTVCHSNRFADQLTGSNESSPVFAYLLAEPDPNSEYRGASHGRDAAYFVGEPLRRDGYDQEQRDLSRQMMVRMAGFLASGNLTETGWQPTDRLGLRYYRFLVRRSGGGPGAEMLSGGHERQDCRLWDELLPWLGDAGGAATTIAATPPPPATADPEAEAKFWERCNATVNTVSIIVISIGGCVILLLLACVILVARGRRGSSHDSVELYQRVSPSSIVSKG